MIRKEFLDLLRCPVSRGSLTNAEAELLERINKQIDTGDLVKRDGEVVSGKIEGGLVNEARSLIYPVQNDIPCLLADEAIALDQLAPPEH